MTVIDRHKQLEEIKAQQEELARKKEEEKKIVENVEAVIEEIEEEIIAPVEIETTTSEDEEERYVIMFTVRGTKSQLKELKLCTQQLYDVESLRIEVNYKNTLKPITPKMKLTDSCLL